MSGTNEIEVWRRHPSDVARLVLSGVVLGLLLAISAWAPASVRGFSADLLRVVRRLPDPVEGVLLGLAQVAALAAPVLALAWLVGRRRLRLLGATAAGVVSAALATALLQGWLDRTVPSRAVQELTQRSWITGAAFPSGAYLAALTAAVVIMGSGSTREWRRVGLAAVVAGSVVRLITAVAVPLNLGVTLALGAAVGSLVLVVMGAPLRRLSPEDLLVALRAIGYRAGSIEETAVGAAHSRTFRATGDHAPDPAAFVKVLGRDERAAEVFSRSLRALRVRGLADERAGWSAPDTARNEALAGLLARGHGTRAADVLAAGASPEGDGITVLQPLNGRLLATFDGPEVTDEILRDAWRQLALLQQAKIAHRWFDPTHLLVDQADGTVVLDFRWAAVGANERLLAIDVADLAVGLASLVGVDRAVSAGAAEFGAEPLAAALPVLQPLVLSPANRKSAKAQPKLLGDLRTAVAEVSGAGEVELAPVARLTGAKVLAWVGIVVMAYAILGFTSNLPQIRLALRDADWAYLPLLVALSAGSYVTGAMQMLGAVPQRLPFLRTIEVMFAQSFLNRFTPANAGGMALRVRYLQAHGSDLPAAAASVGLTSVAGGVMQVVVLGVLMIWTGTSQDIGLELPGIDSVAIILAVVLLIGATVVALPWTRRMMKEKVFPMVGKGLADLKVLARSPAKVGLLFGGALLGKMTTLAAFVLSARALGVEVPAAVLCLLYMTANTVASAAPTPGGVGVIEAALVAVLTGVGVESAPAISVVVVFRLITYWLPIPFCWLALTHLRRTNVL